MNAHGHALLASRLSPAVIVVRPALPSPGVLPRWAGWVELLASGMYLFNQGDILATAVPGFPVWDLGGLLGSTLWAVWLLVLGVLLLRRPARAPSDRPTASDAAAPSAAAGPASTGARN